jgi:ribose 5-phosphate isomerase B
MTIYIGADHRGFVLKERIKGFLAGAGHAVHDCGAFSYDKADDYPDFAKVVAEGVTGEAGARGVLLCGFGNGMMIAANKARGIRAALAATAEQARAARTDEDANVLVLAADYLGEEAACEITEAFLSTPFLGEERHVRRIGKIE